MLITAREILNLTRQQVLGIQAKDITVTYDDNVQIVCRDKDVIFDRFCWELFLLYPDTPITSACATKTILNGSHFDGDTHKKVLETIYAYICEYNKLLYYYQKERLSHAVMIVSNLIYNEIVHRVGDHVLPIDAVDFINVVNDPKIRKIHAELRPNPENIERAYKDIKSYMNDGSVKNRFVAAYRSKAINENQANQCIGPRGFVTDLDRYVFKQPIMNGFIRGMGSLYELITESRTAAKSLNANDTHIKTSEYASRRIQLLTMSVVAPEPGDCGSTEYLDLFVAPIMLENMKGKYYLRSDTNTLDYIRGNETHLVGEVIKVRTALGCKLHDPYKICTCCLGKISENFKENSNLGYTMTSSLMEKLTQTILSTKHLTHSVRKSLIQLEGDVKRFFYVNEDNNLYFKKDIDLKGLYLVLPNSKLSKLVDVLNLPHTNISLTKIGELEVVGIKDTKSKSPAVISVDISYKDRLSIITKSLLEHIKSIKLESDSRGNFVIPMETFDINLPVFNNPLKETNIVSFVNKVAGMIETNKDKVTDPYEKLLMVFSTVIDQLKCNMSVIEVIIYATTTYNAANGNYRLGRNSATPRTETKTMLFRHRSASSLLIFEEQMSEIIKNPVTMFTNVNRSDHPTDVLFEPGKVLKAKGVLN